jgi:hypothetical protein
MARADGSLRSLLARLSRIDVSEPERRDFWEICEDRYQVSRWHEQIGDPTGEPQNAAS